MPRRLTATLGNSACKMAFMLMATLCFRGIFHQEGSPRGSGRASTALDPLRYTKTKTPQDSRAVNLVERLRLLCIKSCLSYVPHFTVSYNLGCINYPQTY